VTRSTSSRSPSIERSDPDVNAATDDASEHAVVGHREQRGRGVTTEMDGELAEERLRGDRT
jgi:hypothetical protein